MNLSTTHVVKELNNGRDAQLVVITYFEGEVVNNFVLASGPKADIIDLREGRITMRELRRRWYRPASV